MSVNYKSLLQNHLQARQCALPNYCLIGAKERPPQFRFSVSFSGACIEGDWCSSKKEATKSAAQKAWNRIEPRSSQQTPSSPSLEYVVPMDFDTVVLIDLENAPEAGKRQYPEKTWVIGCIGAFCNRSKSFNLDLRIIDSPTREAADHLLTWSAAQLCFQFQQEHRTVQFELISSDHAIASLTHLIRAAGFAVKHHPK